MKPKKAPGCDGLKGRVIKQIHSFFTLEDGKSQNIAKGSRW
jgi:hypothetical protein